MDFLDDHQIKKLCGEALDITDQHGVYKGLSFLIGLKFHAALKKLKDAQNQMKLLHGDVQEKKFDTAAGATIVLTPSLSLRKNYVEWAVKVRFFQKNRDQFIQDIKDTFEIGDIQDYLSSYPRLGCDEDFHFPEGGISQKVSPFTTQEVLSEARDILYVEEMKRFFS